MKRLLPLLLAAAMLLSLAACGLPEIPTPPRTGQSSEKEAADASPAPTVKQPHDNTGVTPHGTLLGDLSCDAEPGTVYSEIRQLPAGESVTLRFYNYTDGIGMWNNFLLILQSVPEGHSAEDNPNYAEFAVLRADNFGSGSGFKDAVSESDWNWDTFTDDMNGALIELTVSSDEKESTVDVSFTASTVSGKEYHQSYTGIKADGPLYYCLSVERACLDLLDGETEES